MKLESITVRLGKDELYKNITEDVQGVVGGWQDALSGFVHIMSMHTTCAVVLNEDEPCLMVDLIQRLDRMAPQSVKVTDPRVSVYMQEDMSSNYYLHDDSNVRTENLEEDSPERTNGHSHVRAMLLSPQPLILPVRDSGLMLGKWQQVLFFDFDDLDERRERTVRVSLM